jgi:hypothetical protein
MKTQSHIVNSVSKSTTAMKLLVAYENSQTAFFLTLTTISCFSGAMAYHLFDFFRIFLYQINMHLWLSSALFLMPIMLLLITKLVSTIINNLQFVDLFNRKQIFVITYIVSTLSAIVTFVFDWNLFDEHMSEKLICFFCSGLGVSIIISLIILISVNFIPSLAKKLF